MSEIWKIWSTDRQAKWVSHERFDPIIGRIREWDERFDPIIGRIREWDERFDQIIGRIREWVSHERSEQLIGRIREWVSDGRFDELEKARKNKERYNHNAVLIQPPILPEFMEKSSFAEHIRTVRLRGSECNE
jgi:hypothetical protein